MTANPCCCDQRLRTSEPAIASPRRPFPDYERIGDEALISVGLRKHDRGAPGRCSHGQEKVQAFRVAE
jgi:hypothetical protein